MQTSRMPFSRSFLSHRDALFVALVYAGCAAVWILFSDQAVALLVSDPASIIYVSMLKGWLFVLVTALLLYVLVGRLVARLQQVHQRETGALRDKQRTLDLLSDSEEHLRLLAEHAPAALAMFDRDMRYLVVSRRWSEDFRLGQLPLIGRSHYEVFPEVSEELKLIHARGMAGESVTFPRLRFPRQDGSTQVLNWAMRPWIRPDAAVGGIVLFIEDITQRVQAEDALRSSQQRFQDIAAVSADWIWERDADARYTFASDTANRLLGYDQAEILGKTPFDFMPPAEASRMRAQLASLVAQQASFRDLEYTVVHKDGHLIHLATSGAPSLSQDGRLAGYRGLDRDISQHKAAEAALQQVRDMLQAVLNTIPDLLWLKDLQGRYLACNARFEAFFGATEAQILGKTDFDFVPHEMAMFFRQHDQAALAADRPLENEEEVAFANDGHKEILQTIKTPYRGADGSLIGVLGIARDMTKRKADEQRLTERNLELERFNRASVGRELDMIALKLRVNSLTEELGREPPFALAFLHDQPVRPPGSQAL